MTAHKFKRLVRFEDSSWTVHYGEVPASHGWSDDLTGLSVPTYSGGLPWESGFKLTGTTATIAKVLRPIETTPIVYGVGLNYRQHAEEAKVKLVRPNYGNKPTNCPNKIPLPPYPMIFVKGAGSSALADPYEDIPIHKEAQFMDYEGELTIIFGKKAKDLTESDNVADYLLGYTVGNDVSSRYWQDPVRAGGQHGYAKAFDKFAPIGPILVSPAQMPDPTTLTMRTIVNGQQRQITKTDDLIFDIPAIVRHLTRGRTIEPGTVVLTGTPSGVAAFMKPPAWLQNGDVVEVEISEIGKIRNKMVFDSAS
ncbi:Fumarylacetoacetate hydrolase domain-containing protein 2 [Fonsecaea pedrosoi]|nr:Fumarylacetoacetate hydrolase domain-containing protein 2 [Fonsecaea pedrosoi]